MDIKFFEMGKRKIGSEHPCLIIGEVAQAHDGSLGMAHAYIDAIANAGADAVKFQTHIAHAESSQEEMWRVKFSYQDETRYDYWKRMEFTKEQWEGLKKHADERGLIFLSSPFSVEAVELLENIGASAWKIASGELNNSLLFERIERSRLPIIISSGMSNMREIDSIIQRFVSKDLKFALLQCTSAYPCPAEQIGLNLIPIFRNKYGCPVGISDHSGKIYPGLASAVLGANIIEVHITLSRESFGPDVSSSLTTSELKQLVEGVRYIEKMNANPVDKDLIYNNVAPLKSLFNRSIAYALPLSKGTIIRNEHLTLLKPGTGVSPDNMNIVIGKMLKKDVLGGQLLKIEDLED